VTIPQAIFSALGEWAAHGIFTERSSTTNPVTWVEMYRPLIAARRSLAQDAQPSEALCNRMTG
jgi:hypothetical protein